MPYREKKDDLIIKRGGKSPVLHIDFECVGTLQRKELTDVTGSSGTTTTSPTITLRDKAIVLGCWLGIAISIRVILYDLHWFGSIGAIGGTFLIVTLFLKSKYGKRHSERFKRVLRYWFSRKFQWTSLGFAAFAIFMIISINAGYAHYSRNIEASIEPGGHAVSPLGRFEFLAAYADHSTGGMFSWSSWVMVYEDAEYLIFLVLVRKGLVFRELREP